MDSAEENKPLSANPTLFHFAIVYNNLDSIKSLLAAGYDVAADNTALLAALTSINFEAVKILLDADASVHDTDESTGKSALAILMAGLQASGSTELIEDVVPRLVDNMKRSPLGVHLDVGAIAESLVAAECPIRYVASFKDAQLTRKFMECEPSKDDTFDMQLFLKSRDFENVEVLLRYGCRSRKKSFHFVLSIMLQTKEQWELWKDYIEHLSDWDIVTSEAILSLPRMFMLADAKSLQVLLDSKLPLQVKQKYGVDVRTPLFGTSRGVAVQILQDPNFHVNEPSLLERSALHYAADQGVVKNMQLLLDSGAEVNIKDYKGRTALFTCTFKDPIKSGRLLLEHGADVQVIMNDGTTLFELARKEDSPLFELFIAQLAIAYTKGEPIKQAIKNKIESNEDDKKIYEACCQQLQVLKTSTVVGSITLFTVLAEAIEKLDRSLCDEKTIPRLEQCIESQRRNVHSLYCGTLNTKLIQATNLYEFKCKMASVITKSTGTYVSFDHLVVEEISKYCNRREIKSFINFKSSE